MRLASDTFAAVVGDDLVLLQTGRDRYLCLPGAAAKLRLGSDGKGFATADGELAKILSSVAIVQTSGRAPMDPAPRPAMRPCRDRPLSAPGARPADIWRLTCAVLDLSRGYLMRPLGPILGFARRSNAGLPPPSVDPELIRLAAVFDRLAPWLPISGKCLVRSFVLLRFLQRSGRDADWVFGVRVWPFSAHCWLQVGDMALDDHADRLRAYEPILAA